MYNLTVQLAPTYFVALRTYAIGDVIIPTKEYGDLRTFYSQLEAKDQEAVILKAAPATASAASTTPAGGN